MAGPSHAMKIGSFRSLIYTVTAMTEVRETLHVRCRREVTHEQLCAMLLEGSHGEVPQALLLTVKVPWTGIELSKEVNVEYTVPAGPSHVDDPVGVRWTPTPGGIYPSFAGELRVLPGAHAYSSVLELVGHYTPPLGVLGMGFDAAVGHKVAEATMKYLLEGLASGIVAREYVSEWQEASTELREEVELQRHVQVIRGVCIVERPMLPPPVSEA